MVELLGDAIDTASDDDGWAGLGAIGSFITRQHPNFDSRSYGYGKLSVLVTAITLSDIFAFRGSQVQAAPADEAVH